MTPTADPHPDPNPAGLQPFDVTNRAWQRFLTLAEEHFQVLVWCRDSDARPALVTLIDLATGDSFSLAVLDSIEQREVSLVLSVTGDGQVQVYGPFADATAGARGAATTAANPAVVATCVMPLAHPDQLVPATAWMELPDHLRDRLSFPDPEPEPAVPAVLVLTDLARTRIAAVGPFAEAATAATWPHHTADLHAHLLTPRTGPDPAEP